MPGAPPCRPAGVSCSNSSTGSRSPWEVMGWRAANPSPYLAYLKYLGGVPICGGSLRPGDRRVVRPTSVVAVSRHAASSFLQLSRACAQGLRVGPRLSMGNSLMRPSGQVVEPQLAQRLLECGGVQAGARFVGAGALLRRQRSGLRSQRHLRESPLPAHAAYGLAIIGRYYRAFAHSCLAPHLLADSATRRHGVRSVGNAPWLAI